MKTINIKGKEYVEVSTRVAYFRAKFPGWSLRTEVLEKTEASIMVMAKVLDENDRVIATGLAEEHRDDKRSMVNKTSYVENCETSAWGRALGNLGIGIDTSIASFDEVSNAISQAQNIANKTSASKNMKTDPLTTAFTMYPLVDGKRTGGKTGNAAKLYKAVIDITKKDVEDLTSKMHEVHGDVYAEIKDLFTVGSEDSIRKVLA